MNCFKVLKNALKQYLLINIILIFLNLYASQIHKKKILNTYIEVAYCFEIWTMRNNIVDGGCELWEVMWTSHKSSSEKANLRLKVFQIVLYTSNNLLLFIIFSTFKPEITSTKLIILQHRKIKINWKKKIFSWDKAKFTLRSTLLLW